MRPILLDGIEYVDVAATAAHLRITPGRVRQLCTGGRIEGTRLLCGRWLLPIESVLAFAQIPRKAGHPPKLV